MPKWFSAPILTACLCGLLDSSHALADTPLADYKTDTAKAAVKAYATADATQGEADKLLDGIKGSVDVSKVKEGAGLEVKDSKGTWTAPLKKATLTDEEAQKVKDDLPKFLAAALKADTDAARKLSEADQNSLVKAIEVKTGMPAPPIQGTVALTAFTTQMARAAVKAYVTADATKAEAEATLTGIASLIDVEKVKDGSALEVKEAKAVWSFTTTAKLEESDTKKVSEALEKLLAAALKADKKLSAADLAKLAKGTTQTTQAAPAGTMTADKLTRATAAATVKAFLNKAESATALKPLDDAALLLNVAEIKRRPNLEYDPTAKQLVWNLPYTDKGGSELLSGENEKPEDETKKEAERKKLKESLRPVLKAALQSEKNPAKRLTDADLEKVVSGAKFELRRQLSLDDFLADNNLQKAVAAYLDKNKDALKPIKEMTPPVVDADGLTQDAVGPLAVFKQSGGWPANNLTVSDEKEMVWKYRRLSALTYVTDEQKRKIEKTLRDVLVAAARGYDKPLSQEALELFDKLYTGEDGTKLTFVETVGNTPLANWTTTEFRNKLRAYLKRVNVPDEDSKLPRQLRDELQALGVAVALEAELDQLVSGLTYSEQSGPTFVWNYFAKKRGQPDLSDADKNAIRVKLQEVLGRALAFPRLEGDLLSLSNDDLKKVNATLADAEKAKIEYKDLSSAENVQTSYIRGMIEDYLNQPKPDADTAVRLTELKRALNRAVDYSSLLDESKMEYLPPKGQTDGKFTWKLKVPLGRKVPEGPAKDDAVARIRQLLVEAVKNPQRDLYRSMTDETRAVLVGILRKAEISFVETELANVFETLNALQDRLERAEARIEELEKKVGEGGGSTPTPAPVVPFGPQYQTFQVTVPCGLFGCRTRTTTVTVPVR